VSWQDRLDRDALVVRIVERDRTADQSRSARVGRSALTEVRGSYEPDIAR
jgi:hypothetical protein